MIVNGTLSVECEECGKVHNIGANETDFEITSRDSRSQGQERGYTWETEFNCDGNNNTCGNHIEIECEAWEYPSGIYNDDNVTVQGATEVDRFTYDFSEQPEPDDVE